MTCRAIDTDVHAFVGIVELGLKIRSSCAERFVALPFCTLVVVITVADLVVATVANIFVLLRDIFTGNCKEVPFDLLTIVARPIVVALLLTAGLVVLLPVTLVALGAPQKIWGQFQKFQVRS